MRLLKLTELADIGNEVNLPLYVNMDYIESIEKVGVSDGKYKLHLSSGDTYNIDQASVDYLYSIYR